MKITQKIITASLLIAAPLLMSGCFSNDENENWDSLPKNKKLTNSLLNMNLQTLNYVYDERTGLCFACLKHPVYLGSPTSISHVPCTPEVLALVPKELSPIRPNAVTLKPVTNLSNSKE